MSKVNGDQNNDTSLPALDAIVQLFSPIRYMKKDMEMNTSPMMHQLLPFFYNFRIILQQIEAGLVDSS